MYNKFNQWLFGMLLNKTRKKERETDNEAFNEQSLNINEHKGHHAAVYNCGAPDITHSWYTMLNAKPATDIDHPEI